MGATILWRLTTMEDDSMGMKDRARESQGDFAPGWAPEPGDEVYGVVVARGERTTKMRGQDVTYPIVTIATVEVDDDDEATGFTGSRLAIHCVGKALRDDLAAETKVGDYVYVEYVGPMATQSGNTFQKYNAAIAEEGSDDYPEGLGEPPAAPEAEDTSTGRDEGF